MAIAEESVHDVPSSGESKVGSAPPPRKQKFHATRWMAGLVVLGGLGAAGLATTRWANPFEATPASITTHTVSRSNLLVTVTENGNVESSSNVDIKCRVAGGSTILWIIADGTMVEKGDEIVRLDDSSLEDQVNQQKIAYERALATKIQADKDVSTAEIAVEEYINGTYVQEKQLKEADVTVARQNLKAAENESQHANRMARKGFITALERESKKQAVQRANFDLDAAETALKVLEEYTKRKMMEDLESQVATAKANLRSEEAALQLEEAKPRRLESQLENCLVTAPQGGMVVYANDMGSRRFGQQSVAIEEGASVRDMQTLIKLPDLSKMQVKVVVHESKVDSIRAGMRAVILIQGQQLQGKVVSVATQPEPGSFFSTNVKEYATIVQLDGEVSGIKPGMTAEVEILIAELNNVLTVPVSAVMEHRGKFICWVLPSGGKPERRVVGVGQSSTTMVHIKDGLTEGEQVILDPRDFESRYWQSESGQGEAAEEEGSASEKFGSNGAEEEKSSAGSDAAGPNPDRTQGRGGREGRGNREGRGGGPEGGPGAAAPTGGKSGERRGGRGKGGPPRMNFADNDKNSDGKITKDELPERLQPAMQFLDSNKDGGIDKSEWDAAMERFRKMREQGGFGGGGGPPAQ